ncbi:HNH endonuclease [Mycobacterium yunnanensis]|uniref:HNH endonuclease n=1 Tax=Mycobacterium yunnanensis TaxID=368477 RepID=A0A9X2Z6M3_9MYCO|nr:HNH endonuclease signature motif containing protein [Mycobacterium yunnanensis]MCV7424180.1 HNH endonuclease [Mycobacterium yunnanensis]
MPTGTTSLSSKERLDVLFDELAGLTGQRNAIDGRIVDIVAEIDGDGLWGNTGCRSISALVAWRIGVSPHNAQTITTVAERLPEFPSCTAALREGRLSLDQVGVIAERAGDGSDEHYAQLASVATVTQLRTAIALEPRADAKPSWEPDRSISKTETATHTTWRIRLPKVEAAKFEAALASHRDGLINDWKTAHDEDQPSDQAPPFPTNVDAFTSLVEAGWDADVARRPHGQHTTVVVHLDVEKRSAGLHLGPVLSDADRQYLLCDAMCEVWVERHGQPIGAGRGTRTISRRLRRVLEHRDRCCAVPGCGATRGLHAHHIRHWEDGGPTDPDNLVLLCPFHHRLHHTGGITISGTATHLVVTDADGTELTGASLARPPTQPPPAVPPCTGPLGERADCWWYDPYDPNKSPPSEN